MLAGQPLAHTHHRDEVVHGRPPACRAQKFPEAISFNAAFSNSASASSRFNVLFSRSRSFSLLASSAFNPPNWFRHRSYVCSETPNSRQTSATSLPSASSRSAWVSFRTTCSGVCLLLVVIVIKPSCPSHGRQDSYSTRINQQGSRQHCRVPRSRPRLRERDQAVVQNHRTDRLCIVGSWCVDRLLGGRRQRGRSTVQRLPGLVPRHLADNRLPDQSWPRQIRQPRRLSLNEDCQAPLNHHVPIRLRSVPDKRSLTCPVNE